MFFIVFAKDKAGSLSLRLKHRDEHLAYWLEKGGIVKVAGAMLESESAEPAPIGSSFLLEAVSVQDVSSLIANDPFTLKGVFSEDILIQPVRPAIGEWKKD